jgi:peptide/nickel transport system substrate-binding protein
MGQEAAEEPKPGGSLSIAARNEPRTLGLTNWASDVVASQMSQNIYNSLVRFDLASGSFVSELAEEWEQTDLQTWVFRLRKGVQFHKGYGEMTAEDVAFTVNHIIETKGPSLYYYSFVKNVEVVWAEPGNVVLLQG